MRNFATLRFTYEAVDHRPVTTMVNIATGYFLSVRGLHISLAKSLHVHDSISVIGEEINTEKLLEHRRNSPSSFRLSSDWSLYLSFLEVIR